MGRRGLLVVAAVAMTAAAAATALAAVVSLAELAERQVKKAAGRIDNEIDADETAEFAEDTENEEDAQG